MDNTPIMRKILQNKNRAKTMTENPILCQWCGVGKHSKCYRDKICKCWCVDTKFDKDLT